MKKLLFAFVLAVVLVSGCTQPPAGNPGTPSVNTTNVAIQGFAFNPPAITVSVGDTVTWTNQDSVPHDVASDPHPTHTDLPGLRSGTLNPGQSYSFTFDKAGTWSYHCHLHPTMKGAVTVQ